MDPLGTHRWPTAPGIDRYAVSTPCITLVDDIHPLELPIPSAHVVHYIDNDVTYICAFPPPS